jgi:hypothetical protein
MSRRFALMLLAMALIGWVWDAVGSTSPPPPSLAKQTTGPAPADKVRTSTRRVAQQFIACWITHGDCRRYASDTLIRQVGARIRPSTIPTILENKATGGTTENEQVVWTVTVSVDERMGEGVTEHVYRVWVDVQSGKVTELEVLF